jgi:hypothetical protein
VQADGIRDLGGPERSGRGHRRSRHGLASAVAVGAAIALAGLAAGGFTSSGAARGSVVPMAGPAVSCPATTSVPGDGGTFASCAIPLSWGLVGPAGSTPVVTTEFDGVSFYVYAYETIDCPVVNVTGHETGGATFSFLICPSPDNCQFAQPLVYSADHVFGAEWTGGSSVLLLARLP